MKYGESHRTYAGNTVELLGVLELLADSLLKKT